MDSKVEKINSTSFQQRREPQARFSEQKGKTILQKEKSLTDDFRTVFERVHFGGKK